MDIYLAGSNGRRDFVDLAIRGDIDAYILGRAERQKSHPECIYRRGYDINDVSPEEILKYGNISCRRGVRQPISRMAKSFRKIEGGGYNEYPPRRFGSMEICRGG